MQHEAAPPPLVGSVSSSYINKPTTSSLALEPPKMDNLHLNSSPSTLDEAQWKIVMKNCNVLHGWFFDSHSRQLKIAPKPAFALKRGYNMPGSPELLTEEDIARRMHRGDAIPDFCVNDGTKIDVIVVEDDIRDSMVRNSFAKSSVDAKVGGGYAGIGIGLATGTNTQLQNGGSDEHKRSAQKMIGQYKLPRATLFLAPDDLVATPQLSEQVKKIRRHGSPADIRKFHRTFGEFFSHEVTVGGMLTSTKTWEANERSTQERSKDDFKQTIGLAISSPVDVGVDAKRESMGSTDDSYSRGYRDNSEQVVFEAIGGNTILTSSPQLWCQTVSDFANWRAIERTGLQSILESITQCDTMELRGAAKWFSNAISSERMSVSIDVPASGDLFAQIRFRTKTSDNRDQYLVYRFEDPVSITIMDQPVGPERFQGPKIKPYDRCTWTDSTTGIWTIKHRGDGNKLKDGSRVTIRTSKNFRSQYLSVIRTSADFFAPCITTSGHEPVWRIRKAPNVKKPLPLVASSDFLNDSDLFCLTFVFEDNPHGYRDFARDSRGFRNRTYPPEVPNNRLVLVQSAGTSGGWKDRTVLLLDDENNNEEAISRSVKVFGNDVTVSIASFWMSQLDGTDDDGDVLLKFSDDNEGERTYGGKSMMMPS